MRRRAPRLGFMSFPLACSFAAFLRHVQGGPVMTPIRKISSTSARMTAAVALALVVALCVAAAPASAGPIGFQASGGWYTDSGDFFLGAGARVGFARVTFIPNAEWIFVDSGSEYTLNLDATLSLFPLGVASA